MKGPSSLVMTALALLLLLSVLGNSCGAPQRLFERRNWTPQAMLYLKGAQGRRFISDQGRRKELADRPPPAKTTGRHFQETYDISIYEDRHEANETSSSVVTCHQLYYLKRRNPDLQLLTLPEAAALLLASLQKPQEDEGGNFDQSRFLEDRLLNW